MGAQENVIETDWAVVENQTAAGWGKGVIFSHILSQRREEENSLRRPRRTNMLIYKTEDGHASFGSLFYFPDVSLLFCSCYSGGRKTLKMNVNKRTGFM